MFRNHPDDDREPTPCSSVVKLRKLYIKRNTHRRNTRIILFLFIIAVHLVKCVQMVQVLMYNIQNNSRNSLVPNKISLS